jgi:hypothetical protein
VPLESVSRDIGTEGFALLYARLGEKEQAIEWLEK